MGCGCSFGSHQKWTQMHNPFSVPQWNAFVSCTVLLTPSCTVSVTLISVHLGNTTTIRTMAKFVANLQLWKERQLCCCKVDFVAAKLPSISAAGECYNNNNVKTGSKFSAVKAWSSFMAAEFVAAKLSSFSASAKAEFLQQSAHLQLWALHFCGGKLVIHWHT